MWVITNKGPLSIVAKDAAGKPSGNEPEAIVSVRFRRKGDAAKLFPEHKRVDTPGGDYCCRVFATRREVADALVAEVLGMSYTNFKSSIPRSDAALSGACHHAWDVFGKLQPGGPYGRSLRQPAIRGERDFFDYDPPARKLTASPEKGRRKATARQDPFCDDCGMRVGVANLTINGICKDCARFAREEAEAAAASEANPGECWNCHRIVDERNSNDLCGNCDWLYDDTDPAVMEQLLSVARKG